LRTARVERRTAETTIVVELALDGAGRATVSTGLPFFDHMLDQLARHGGFDLTVACDGDLHVDSHHSVEDVAIAIGEALRMALGDKVGVRRFASGLFPLDEALVEVALDLSGRPFAAIDLPMGYPDGTAALPLGTPPFNPELAEHFFVSLATAGAITLHVRRAAGRNTHHVIEAAFKGVARCLRDAVRVESAQLPSTKGVL
jgi:imidazoleglycerol-phosphate dehydratase